MEGKKTVFISAYCQNTYQEDRIKNFVGSQSLQIVNPLFNVKKNGKKFSSLDHKIDKISSKEMGLISNADEIWILIGSLDSNLPESKIKMHAIDNYSKNLNKPLKYFYLYQSGRSMGKAKSLDRKEIFNSAFYKYLHEETN
jgi:hypothetical protein